jgi:cobaltochelatase CobN
VLNYCTHWMSGNREFVDALVEAVEGQGCNVLPVFCYSLRGTDGPPATFRELILMSRDNRASLSHQHPQLQHGLTGGAGRTVAEGWSVEPRAMNVPIIQAITSTSSHTEWARRRPHTARHGHVRGDSSSMDASLACRSPSKRWWEDNTIGGWSVCRWPTACRWWQAWPRLRLRHTPNAAKRVAVLFSSYPTKAARIGNAVGLDSPASLMHLLDALRQAGYDLGVEPVPPDSDNLMQTLIASGTYDKEFLTEEQLQAAVGRIHAADYQQWYEAWPPAVRTQLREAWGEPPGTVYRHNGAITIAGLRFGNVFVGFTHGIWGESHCHLPHRISPSIITWVVLLAASDLQG